MSDVVVVAPLGEADAAAVRWGDDVFVHVSPSVPEWARSAAVEHLRRVLHASEGRAVAVTLAPGEAVGLARDDLIPRQRRASAGKLVAAAAVIVMPLGLAAVLISGQAPDGGAPLARPGAGAPAAPGPSDPAPDPVPAEPVDVVEEVPVRVVTSPTAERSPATRTVAEVATPAPAATPPVAPVQPASVAPMPPERTCATNPRDWRRARDGHSRRHSKTVDTRPAWTAIDQPAPIAQAA